MEQELKNTENNSDNEDNQKDIEDNTVESQFKPKIYNGDYDLIQVKQFCKKIFHIISYKLLRRSYNFFKLLYTLISRQDIIT